LNCTDFARSVPSRNVSAIAGRVLTLCLGNFVEGKVLDGGVGVLAPLVEEAAIAEGDERRGIEAEFAAGGVDPFGRTFEFGIDADGGLVEDAMAGRVGILGAVFFVGERRLEAELGEDVADGFAILHLGFRLFAMLVGAGGVVVGGQAFVGDDPAFSLFANAEDALLSTEAAVRRVVEDVAFEGARGIFVEAGGEKAAGERGGVLNAEFDFGLDRHEYRL